MWKDQPESAEYFETQVNQRSTICLSGTMNMSFRFKMQRKLKTELRFLVKHSSYQNSAGAHGLHQTPVLRVRCCNPSNSRDRVDVSATQPLAVDATKSRDIS